MFQCLMFAFTRHRQQTSFSGFSLTLTRSLCYRATVLQYYIYTSRCLRRTSQSWWSTEVAVTVVELHGKSQLLPTSLVALWSVDQTRLLLNSFSSVVHCNCSVCEMKQNHHFIVPRDRFVLETGTSLISTYTFNTHAAKSGYYIKISQPNVNTWNLDINFVLSVESRVSTFQDLTRTELV